MTVTEWLDKEKEMLETLRETLRTAPNFQCAACGDTKERAQALGVRVYRPDRNSPLESKQVAPAAYVLCLECEEILPPAILHQKVTQYLATQGLFG